VNINSSPTVLIMAGGTGGHVFPALAVADCLRDSGFNVEWLGTHRGIESRVVPAANIPIHYILASGLRGKNILNSLRALVMFTVAFFQSAAVIFRVRPVCVLGMGGFVSAPGGLASWLLRKYLVIHEQNAVAGTSNKMLSKLARRVLLGYPIELGGEKSEFVGNPIRGDISALLDPKTRFENRDRLRLLVIGGSQGSRPINECLPKALAAIPVAHRPLVWHQAGSAHIDVVRDCYGSLDVDVKAEAFIEDMAEAYQWADLVLCRSGALTVAELSAVGIASILVPLPYAIDDHQTANAKWLTDNGAGILMRESDMSVASVSELLESLSGDRDRLLEMAVAARRLSKNKSAQRVADICVEKLIAGENSDV